MVGQRAASGAEGPTGPAVSTLISDARLQRLFDYWCSKRGTRNMPSRRDIDPLEIGWALPYIFLVDYDPAKGITYRLAGGQVAGMFGHGNLKGLQPRDFLPADRAGAIEATFLRVIQEPAVMVMRGMVYLRADRLPMGERLFLPLADAETGSANGVLGMTVVNEEHLGTPSQVAQAEPVFLPLKSIP